MKLITVHHDMLMNKITFRELFTNSGSSVVTPNSVTPKNRIYWNRSLINEIGQNPEKSRTRGEAGCVTSPGSLC